MGVREVMKMRVEEKIKQIIYSIIGNDDCNSSITDDSDLINDIGMDSIQIMQLVVELENEFNIEFDDDDLVMENLAKVNNLVQLIDNLNNCLTIN
jgi:acyl carrier protein